MAYEYLLIGCIVLFFLVSTFMISVGCIEKYGNIFAGGCALCVVSVSLLIGIGLDWNKRVIDHATNFFNKRDDVYKCEGLKPLQCDYKLKMWREDSIMWYNKVKNIMEGN